MAMERILVGVDGSAPSLKAVDLAADLASKYNAELILLKAVEDRPRELDAAVEEYARSEHIPAAEAEVVLKMANDILDNARKAALAKGAAQISVEPSFGDPAAQIIAAARDREADLIVVGSRGHGRVAGLLLGSVAQKVVSLANCPVVVVR
jgi:nucleotide-binding universal stress UspA family protein